MSSITNVTNPPIDISNISQSSASDDFKSLEDKVSKLESRNLNLQDQIEQLCSDLDLLRDNISKISSKRIYLPFFEINDEVLECKSGSEYDPVTGKVKLNLVFEDPDAYQYTVYPLGYEFNHIEYGKKDVTCKYIWSDGKVVERSGLVNEVNKIVVLYLQDEAGEGKWPLRVECEWE